MNLVCSVHNYKAFKRICIYCQNSNNIDVSQLSQFSLTFSSPFQKLVLEAADPSGGRSGMAHYAWMVPENVEIVVTLFHHARRSGFEDKEWTFSVEAVRRNFVRPCKLPCQLPCLFKTWLSTDIHYILWSSCHISWPTSDGAKFPGPCRQFYCQPSPSYHSYS